MSSRLRRIGYVVGGIVVGIAGVFLIFAALTEVLSVRQTLALIAGVLLMDAGTSMAGHLGQETSREGGGSG